MKEEQKVLEENSKTATEESERDGQVELARRGGTASKVGGKIKKIKERTDMQRETETRGQRSKQK